ncbi:MAG: histone deacetylase [Methanosarcinales archaeon]
MSNLAVIYHEGHKQHDPTKYGYPSPERVERVERILEFLKQKNIFERGDCNLVKPIPSTKEDLLRVHTPRLLEFIENYNKSKKVFFGHDTCIGKGTYNACLLSAGGAITAAKSVLHNKYDYSFALIRPPGHHSKEDKFAGFCVVNNAAILAKYLKEKEGLKRIMILNIDAHASNGTSKIFYSDAKVLCVSMHQSPKDFYPFEGFMNEIGKAPATGYTINIEMPPESGDAEYLKNFDEIVIPIRDQFKPEFIIVECGFDSHYADPISRLNLTSKGYYAMTKLTFLLEGGYVTKILSRQTYSIINALTNRKVLLEGEAESVDLAFARETKCIKKYEENFKQLKSIIGDYWRV